MIYTTTEEKITGGWRFNFPGGGACELKQMKRGRWLLYPLDQTGEHAHVDEQAAELLRSMLIECQSRHEFKLAFTLLRAVNQKEKALWQELDTLGSEIKSLKSGLAAASCSTTEKEEA